MSLTIDSQCLTPYKRPIDHRASIELEIDNTGLYIPPGWSRKVFLRTRNCQVKKEILRYECMYFTESGKKIGSKRDAYLYANNKYLPDVDIEKLNFSASQTTIKPDQLLFEVDLDNTGIYIPDGWQRKQYLCRLKRYHIKYLNAEGKRFGCISDMYTYLSHSDSIKEKQIDVEKMDFFTGARSQSSLKKVCQCGQEQEKIMKKKDQQIDIEKYKIVFFFFEVRKTDGTAFNKIYLCKLCKFSTRVTKTAYSHATKHFHNFSIESICNSVLPNKYDYLLCTYCRTTIMKRKKVQAHLQRHHSKQITNTIVSVRCAYMANSNVNKIYCCEICEFACFKYSLIDDHLKNHSQHEIITADSEYHKNKYESDKNALVSICKDKSLDDNELVSDNKFDRKFDKHNNLRIIKNRTTLDKKEKKSGKIEIKVDNTGKYIPEGWQRKVYKLPRGVHKGRCVVRYISPLGRTLCNKTQVSQYIEMLETNVFMEPIIVDKMDFSWKSHMKLKNKLSKIEIKVDNTGKYIPEGWQRKVYKLIKGANQRCFMVSYVSPLGRTLYSQIQVSEYIKKLKSNGIMELINVDKMDFSRKSYR
ncbi:unnamed protein product [Meganyctiphanes norvegica]|uniref:MBD domain-containing protein n=1 Tax=Meganyctiphanes norvegica TaxID=48144 RepID=A0AAV2SDZ7_MEGNR